MTPTQPNIIVCDIDGTVAHMNDRSPYDWSRVGEDSIDDTVRDLLLRYYDTTSIVYVSGRDESCKDITKEWMAKHDVPLGQLFMRKKGDNRKDTEVKREIYKRHLKDYNILFVLDDRNQVVKMWREEGLKVFQVAEGDF